MQVKKLLEGINERKRKLQMLRQVRREDAGITIILPTEKRKITAKEIDSVVKIKATVIKLEFEHGIHT